MHQVVELHLAERAARLLVGKHFLKADHLGRQLADLLLRLVDPRQPLPQIGDDLAGGLFAAIQPLAHDLRKRLLLLAQRALDPLHGLGLLAQGHLEMMADCLRLAIVSPTQHQDQQPGQQQDDDGQEAIDEHIHCPPL